jgi:hypothetical protein
VTIITGTIKNSGGSTINASLRVRLDAPLVDSSTTPPGILTAVPRVFTITAGALSIDLPQSETLNTTYWFQLFQTETVYFFWFLDGTEYFGPTHLHTDGLWYTGDTHSVESSQLVRRGETQETLLLDFHAIVPNVTATTFDQLVPTGVTTDVLDTSLRRLAQILTTNVTYAAALRGGPVWQGNWNSGVYYQYGDAVFYNLRSWVWVDDEITAGVTPDITESRWQLIVAPVV